MTNHTYARAQPARPETCCACSGTPVARVLDGPFRKPVCATHRRLYSERGYLIDALADSEAGR